MNRKAKSGFTMMEVIMAAAILGITAMMSKVIIDLVNRMAMQRSTIEMQSVAQITLQQIQRDVRNCATIQQISSGPATADNYLTLSMFDTRMSDPTKDAFDVNDNSNLFSPNHYLTVSYTYNEDLNGVGYLDRLVTAPLNPGPGTQTLTHISLLKGLLQRPKDPDYLFLAGPFGGQTAPFDAVHVTLKLTPTQYGKKVTKTFEADVIKRGMTK